MRLNQLSKHFCHSDWLIVLSDWQFVGDPTRKNFLRSQCSCNIECLRLSQSHDRLHDDLRCVSKHCDRILEHFFRPIDTTLFWAIDKFCEIKREQIFFTVKCSCNIECLRLSQSHDRSHDDLAISVGVQHQWFPEQQMILFDLHEIPLGVNYDLGWIHHIIDRHWSLVELRCQKFN